MSPACRTPNAAIPPFARGNHHLARHQRRITGPHPVACPPGHRSPAHAPPLNGGFCTIRRIATACRRRVAPLMLQFPPFATPSTAPTATSDGSPAHARSPARRATATGPLNGGFCTIRRTATACRRRVAPLMLQFPPHSPAATVASPATSDGSPAHARSPARPATAHRPTPRRQRGVLHH